MQTTALVVEILVIGLLSLLGIILVVLGLSEVQPQCILKILHELEAYMTIILVIVFAISYQLGWLVNSIAYYFAKLTYMKSVRRLVLGNRAGNYDLMRDKVYLEASDNAVAKVKERMSEVRIARTGVLNILIISIGCYLLNWIAYAVFLFTLSVFVAVSSRFAYKDYVKRIMYMYDELTLKEKGLDHANKLI